MIELSTTDQHLINPCVFSFTTGELRNVQAVARPLAQPLTNTKSNQSNEAASILLKIAYTIIENFRNNYTLSIHLIYIVHTTPLIRGSDDMEFPKA
jgi:hypothetical protein